MMKKIPLGPTIRINVNTEGDKDTIAARIYEHFGLGEYNIAFWNFYKKNKKFSRTHECKKTSCKYYLNRKCRIWSRYQTGWKCKDNPSHRPNWDVYARVTIYAADTDRGYSYKWHNKPNKMGRFWWWKG